MLYGMNERRVEEMSVCIPNLTQDLIAAEAMHIRKTAPIEGKVYSNAVACVVIPIEIYAESDREVRDQMKARVLELIGDSKTMFVLAPK